LIVSSEIFLSVSTATQLESARAKVEAENAHYRAFKRAMSDEERDFAQAELLGLKSPSEHETPELGPVYGRLVIGCSAVLALFVTLWISGKDRPFAGTLLITGAIVAAAIILWFIGRARRAIHQRKAAAAYQKDRRLRQAADWERVLNSGQMYVVRIETDRFAQVSPDSPGAPIYYFADIGDAGIFCMTSEHAGVCNAFELSGFTEDVMNRFFCAGAPMEPNRTLSWSDFEPSTVTPPGEYQIPFPRHGERYQIPYDDLLGLLRVMRGPANIQW
jgi:hypothetical protein